MVRYSVSGPSKRKFEHWSKFVIETLSMKKSEKRSAQGLCIGCGKHPCVCKNRRPRRKNPS